MNANQNQNAAQQNYSQSTENLCPKRKTNRFVLRQTDSAAYSWCVCVFVWCVSEDKKIVCCDKIVCVTRRARTTIRIHIKVADSHSKRFFSSSHYYFNLPTYITLANNRQRIVDRTLITIHHTHTHTFSNWHEQTIAGMLLANTRKNIAIRAYTAA